MISEAYFNNIATLRRAAANNDVALISSRIAATQQPIALVAAMVAHGGEVMVVPFGYLDVPEAIGQDARISEAATAEFKQLLKRMTSKKSQPLLREDDEGHVRVGFGAADKTRDEDCKLVLAWDNPYELFEDPTQ